MSAGKQLSRPHEQQDRAGTLLRLQEQAGNKAVVRLLARQPRSLPYELAQQLDALFPGSVPSNEDLLGETSPPARPSTSQGSTTVAALVDAATSSQRAGQASLSFPSRTTRRDARLAELRGSIGAPGPWGWGYRRGGASMRVDFTFREGGANWSILGRIYERLSDPTNAATVLAQLEVLREGGDAGVDRHFDPELVLTVAAEETRVGSQLFARSGSFTPEYDSQGAVVGGTTFHGGGLDNAGTLIDRRLIDRYLPSQYTERWQPLHFSTPEHTGEISTLTNLRYDQLLSAYGAYIRYLREEIVLSALAPDERAAAEAGSGPGLDTLRFLTRAAFGGAGRFREILGHMRTIGGRSGVPFERIISDQATRDELLQVIPYVATDLSTKTVRRALITTTIARELQRAGVLRRTRQASASAGVQEAGGVQDKRTPDEARPRRPPPAPADPVDKKPAKKPAKGPPGPPLGTPPSAKKPGKSLPKT